MQNYLICILLKKSGLIKISFSGTAMNRLSGTFSSGATTVFIYFNYLYNIKHINAAFYLIIKELPVISAGFSI